MAEICSRCFTTEQRVRLAIIKPRSLRMINRDSPLPHFAYDQRGITLFIHFPYYCRVNCWFSLIIFAILVFINIIKDTVANLIWGIGIQLIKISHIIIRVFIPPWILWIISHIFNITIRFLPGKRVAVINVYIGHNRRDKLYLFFHLCPRDSPAPLHNRRTVTIPDTFPPSGRGRASGP